MTFKKIIAYSIVATIAFVLTVSCQNMPRTSTISPVLKSGNGKTAGTAIVITPTNVLQKSQNLGITTHDNARWFLANLAQGVSYSFETEGQGDPALYIYKKSQVDKNSTINGDPVVWDNDSAGDGNNGSLSFRAPQTGAYYIRIALYAGSNWNGNLEYKIQ